MSRPPLSRISTSPLPFHRPAAAPDPRTQDRADATEHADELCDSPTNIHHRAPSQAAPAATSSTTTSTLARQSSLKARSQQHRTAQDPPAMTTNPASTSASPTKSLARRAGSASPVASISNGHAFSSSAGGAGASFGGVSSSPISLGSGSNGAGAGATTGLTGRARKGSFGSGVGAGAARRWWASRGRGLRLCILVVGAVAVWWLVAARWNGEVKPRQKLMYRWWDAEVVPSGWTAVVHLTSSSQLSSAHLSPLLASLARQSPLAPSRILLLMPSGLEASPSALASLSSSTRDLVRSASYPRGSSPVIGLARATQDNVDTDFVVFVDGHLPTTAAGDGALPREYVRALLHASGTREYRGALLTAGGLSLPSSSASSSKPHCTYPTSAAQRITVPSLPFLVPTSWLLPRSSSSSDASTAHSILQGLSTSLPLELALSVALWTKHALPTYALPLLPASSSAPGDGLACDRLLRALDHSPRVADLFAPPLGGGDGLRALQASGDASKGGRTRTRIRPPMERGAAERADDERAKRLGTGTAVLLVSGRDELEAVRALACRAARRAGTRGDGARSEVRVVVADYDAREEAERKAAQGAGERDERECHLELTYLGTASESSSASASSSSSSSTSSGDPISLALVDTLDALSPAPAFVLYLTDGPRAREYEEVLRWMGGFFGVRKGGERLSRQRAEREMLKGAGEDAEAGARGSGRPTVVGMTREEARRAEWIGALDLEALRHFHTPRIDLSVVTNDRPVSLHRLATSLQTAYYYGDDVSLAVNLEQTADRLTHRLVDDFRWPHGTFSLRHRILLGGLMPAIVESWYPTSNDTYGVLLEDDVEVSPLFYGWLKFTILQYRYTLEGRRASTRLFGVSLYQQKNIELRPEGRQPFDAHKLFDSLALHDTTPYLSQIPCSWGAAYFPEHWREFHAYLALRLSELALPISDPIVPAIRSNKWPRSWKKYFIELVYLRGYSMLYPNYPDFESLSTNHLEKGTHVHTTRVDEKKKLAFEVPLLDATASLVDTLPGGPGHERLPEWDALPLLDLWGALASADEVLERGWQSARMVGACGSRGGSGPSLAAEDLERPRYDARELLCYRTWDRETEGRLVDAQPLKGREDPEPDLDPDVDPADAPAAAALARDPQPAFVRDFADIDEPLPARAAAVRRPIRAAAAVRARAADTAAKDEDEHAHAHEHAEMQAEEVDAADVGRRAGLFPEEDDDDDYEPLPPRAGGAAGRRRRVDFEARRAHDEEAELGLDESEEPER
ncbi:hypothetical protein Rhopal_006106-T1 [Rhodotorula paludigena]|uniref:Glycosyltransferase 2 n=1 Tax=Rhodotorula paludigena TaxID=86838 RepID=A0AAV5GK90_9BASI|nr:hypothetical protein Rhopal_006106-T1 [Rhodotorula paludigena]